MLDPALQPKPGPHAKHEEIERKWLVRDLPDLSGVPGTEISQGYIAVAADGTEVRLRQKGAAFFQTIKSDGGLVRGEIEIPLSQEQFDALWGVTAGRRVEKIRYELSHDGHTIELDVFRGSLTGLVIAEVEFQSREAALDFSPPAWFGAEVTDDKAYRNKNLALNGAPRL